MKYLAPMMIVLLLTLAGLQLNANPAVADTDHEAGDAKLHDLMEESEKLLRVLRINLRDAGKNDQSLEMVVALQKHMLAAKDETPKRVAAIEDADERTKELKAYRVAMANLMQDLCKLEIALLEDRNEDAMASLKQVIGHRFKGHTRFKD
jgi:soluble cytochrome b562